MKVLVDYNSRNCWPLGHADACSLYGGCIYHDVCGASETIRENIIQAKFEGGLSGL